MYALRMTQSSNTPTTTKIDPPLGCEDCSSPNVHLCGGVFSIDGMHRCECLTCGKVGPEREIAQGAINAWNINNPSSICYSAG